jgi:hypothetical protein
VGVGFVQVQGALALDLWRSLGPPARPELGVQRRQRNEKERSATRRGGPGGCGCVVDSPSWRESAEKGAVRIVRMVLVHLALLMFLLSSPSLGLAQCAPCSPLSLSMASQAQIETQEQVTGKV